EGWLAAAEGNVSVAIDLALEAARLAGSSGQYAIDGWALRDAIRFGDQSGLDRVIELGTSIGGPLATTYAAHARAVRDRDPAGIFAAAQQFEQIGALLSAADAAAQAAVAFDDADDRRHSREAGSVAYRLAAQCGGIRTPALD